MNETRIERLSDSDIAAIPPAEVPSEEAAVEKHRRALPAFYHQQHDGRTQAELLQMRDWNRDQIPSQYTVKEWKSLVRQQLHDWAENATKPDSLAGDPIPEPTNRTSPGSTQATANPDLPAATPTEPARSQPASSEGRTSPLPTNEQAANVVGDLPETTAESTRIDQQPEVQPAIPPVTPGPTRPAKPAEDSKPFASLSSKDRELLHLRTVDVVDDPEMFRRFSAIHHRGEHPDTGEPINLEVEMERAAKPAAKKQAEAVMRAKPTDAPTEPEPSRSSTTTDMVQLAADGLGVADPTGLIDGANAAVSLGRAFLDPARRGEHFRNAAISAASVIPLGDITKLFKAKSAAKTVHQASNRYHEGQTPTPASVPGSMAPQSQSTSNPRPASNQRPTTQPGESFGLSDMADSGQLALDAIGIADPTGIADGANAAISLGRAFTDPDRRGEHLQNAAISAVSMIPFAGDLAKIFKAPRATKTVDRATRAMRRQPSGNVAFNPNRIDEIVDAQRVDDIAEGSSMANRTTAGAAAGGSGGGNVPPISPSITDPGDPDRDPRETKRQIEDQRKLQELQDSYLDTLEDVVLATGAFGVALLGAVKAVGVVIASNKSTISNNKHLEELNPVIAGAFVRHELEEVRRNLRRGEALQDQVSKALEIDSEYEDLRARFTTPIDAMKADASSFGANAVTTMGEFVDSVSGASRTLENLSTIGNLLAGAGNGLLDIAKSGLDLLSGKRIGEWIAGKNNEPNVNPNATPAQRFLDDIRDGAYDGRSDFPPFFTSEL
ncbi:hypothetical protein LOC71_22165 [Rhodopirellula sp. JC740]|uniref:Uncharacterized protein n=1 Tax=Rhodopirellula halodulae TaxID=2894198 RepID=A0ABS8NNA6_9BACT|nr:hypothetical protein [Rhodopirellula sp. JC740]MCC9644991.1 hypothetical protein [Rhodopirellula sp. JC740]